MEKKPPISLLYLVHMLNTFSPCLTAAAGTEFARDFFVYFKLKKNKEQGFRHVAFTKNGFSLFRKYLKQKCLIRLLPIVKDSSLLLQNADGPFSVPLWPFSQKGRLWIIGLECCNHPNYLIQTKFSKIFFVL